MVMRMWGKWVLLDTVVGRYFGIRGQYLVIRKVCILQTQPCCTGCLPLRTSAQLLLKTSTKIFTEAQFVKEKKMKTKEGQNEL